MKTWIALRALLDSLESQTEYKNLDASSQRLLEWIAVRVQKEAPLHIQEIILKSEVASPATVHKLLTILEQEGLISMSVDVSDSRRRIVQITTQASRLFSKLDKGLETWAKALAKDSATGGARSAR
jgi:DNA-binding MarR family transcriptional regulator